MRCERSHRREAGERLSFLACPAYGCRNEGGEHHCERSGGRGARDAALALALLALAGCQLTLGPLSFGPTPTPAPPALPSGWTWYHDNVYSFDLPVPPGWQAHAYWNDMYVGDHCQRKVDLVPPASQSVYIIAPDRQGPELVSLAIAVTCPDFDPAQDSHWLRPAGTMTIDGARATLYTASDDIGDQRMAITRFGGHQYTFSYYDEYGPTTPQSQDAAEVALYQLILKDFRYRAR